MAQNIYDNQIFFDGYSTMHRSIHGLKGMPEWPSVIKMLPALKGLNVIDLGSGYGWFCRYAKENGAEHVLGVDVSEKMLDKARQMTENSGIEYRREDLETIILPESTYDLVYSSLTLHYIENIAEVMRRVYSSLKPNGTFVFTAEHPVYSAAGSYQFIVDANGKKSWPVHSYQNEGPRMVKWYVEGVVMHHRLMATYLNSLIKAGFIIRHVEEFSPTAEQVAEDPKLAEERERPMFVLVSAQKPDK